ncbi:flavin reductase [Deinococcus malanensis]
MLSATTARFFGYYPGTVALVTAEHSGTRNVLSVGWHTALSADPPLYGVAVGRERGSHP